MRWAALAIVLAAAGSADARVVMRPRDPAVVQACRTRPTWTEVARCLDKLGTFALERSLDRARLVHVWIDDPELGNDNAKEDAGFYLFIQQKDASWRIGGMFVHGMNDTVVALAPVTIQGHLGYRIDAGTLHRRPLEIDGAPPVKATIRLSSSLYCKGNDHRCTEIQTSCEVMSRGKTLLSFHGTLRVVGDQVFVDGDTSGAGSICVTERTAELGWAEADN